MTKIFLKLREMGIDVPVDVYTIPYAVETILAYQAVEKGGTGMIRDITIGQHFPGNSFVHRLDPRMKIILTIGIHRPAFLAANPAGLRWRLGAGDFVPRSNIPLQIILQKPQANPSHHRIYSGSKSVLRHRRITAIGGIGFIKIYLKEYTMQSDGCTYYIC